MGTVEKGVKFPRVSGAVRPKGTIERAGPDTLTHEYWEGILAETGEVSEQGQGPGVLRIMGWYSSHSEGEMWVSERDQFVRDHVFAADHQVTLVVDSLLSKAGVVMRISNQIELLSNRRVEPDWTTKYSTRLAEVEA